MVPMSGLAASRRIPPHPAASRRIPPRGSAEYKAEYKRAWRLAPDLVAEVVSPNQYRRETFIKVQRSLAAGVALVRRSRVGDLARLAPGGCLATATSAGSCRRLPTVRLGLGGALGGLDMLPGFSCVLDELFA